MQITLTQKRVCKDYEIKNVEEYQDLFVQNDTLL